MLEPGPAGHVETRGVRLLATALPAPSDTPADSRKHQLLLNGG